MIEIKCGLCRQVGKYKGGSNQIPTNIKAVELAQVVKKLWDLNNKLFGK